MLTRASRWNELGNIVGFGFGRKRINNRPAKPGVALIVFVATKLHPSRLRRHQRIPKRLRYHRRKSTVATDVIEVGAVPRLHAGPILAPGVDAAHSTMRHATVTAVVRSMDNRAALILGCAHGFAPVGAAGTQIESPPDLSAQTATNLVAVLQDVEPLKVGGRSPNFIDAAVALPVPGRISGLSNQIPNLGTITFSSPLVSGQFAPNGVKAFLGFGAVTGRVSGRLLAENVATLLTDELRRVYLYQNIVAYVPTPLPQAGDSGMPLVRSTPNGLELLGLHIGMGGTLPGNTPAAFFVPIRPVMDRFMIQVS